MSSKLVAKKKIKIGEKIDSSNADLVIKTGLVRVKLDNWDQAEPERRIQMSFGEAYTEAYNSESFKLRYGRDGKTYDMVAQPEISIGYSEGRKCYTTPYDLFHEGTRHKLTPYDFQSFNWFVE